MEGAHKLDVPKSKKRNQSGNNSKIIMTNNFILLASFASYQIFKMYETQTWIMLSSIIEPKLTVSSI